MRPIFARATPINIALLASLCGCATPPLSPHDYDLLMVLRSEVRQFEPQGSQPSTKPRLRFVVESPIALAQQSSQNGIYKFVSINGGYRADPNTGYPFGLECSHPVETEDMLFGCIMPPAFYMKLVMQYNVALLKNAPEAIQENCSIDTATSDSLTRISADEENNRYMQARHRHRLNQRAYSMVFSR